MPLMIRSAAAVLASTVALAAQAQVAVTQAWARPTIGAATSSAAYFDIVSAQAAKVVGVSSTLKAEVSLHEMRMEGDVMRMREIDAVPLPAGQHVQFRPHGLHVMITGLKAPLKAGDHVPLVLVVEGADGRRANVPVDAKVGPAAP